MARAFDNLFRFAQSRTPLAAGALVVAFGTSGCSKSATPQGSASTAAAPAPAAAKSPRVAPPPPQVQATLDALKKQLGGALKTAMAQGGPVAAVSACNLRAPGITEQVARPGLRVGRTSHRLRNAKNTAPVWAAEAVAALPEKRLDKVPAQQVFDLPDGKQGYLEVILTGELCLSCHGPSSELDAGLKAKLAELYPNDAATGFAKGDLRGFFWAEYDAMVAAGAAEAN